MTKLTDKQKTFCKEYIVEFNATQAAIKAGYKKKNACAMGCENLSKPDIQKELARLMLARNKRLDVDADWVLAESIKSYKFNAQEVFDVDRNPKMVNSTSASKFLEMVGKHTNIKAFEKEEAKKEVPQAITINLVEAVKPVDK